MWWKIRGARLTIGVRAIVVGAKSDHVGVVVIRDWSTVEGHRSTEIAEMRFVDGNDLPSDTSPATQRRIKEYVTGAPVGHRW